MERSKSGNLHDKGKKCTKNPGHEGFISIKDFGLNHLPPKYQNEIVFEYFKKCADRTVLIKTYFVSETRPDIFPGSLFRGITVPMTGTGWCLDVRRCDNTGWGDQFCQCKACKKSRQPKISWWEVRVQTAAHVVCDDLEAADTEVVFFYDDTKSQTIKILGTRVEWVDVKEDRCYLVCVVHDGEVDEVMNALKRMWQDGDRVSDELTKKYRWEVLGDLRVIISHPHGSTKQISFGKRLKDEKGEDGWCVMCYDVPTCPGTSGAMVIWSFRFGVFSPSHSKGGSDGIGRSGSKC